MAYQFQNISILVVEDSQPMLDIVKSLLLAFGIGHVISAKNGEEGFKCFCGHNPDIVIADWMMQPMDGISFTRLIRTDSTSPDIYAPVILMTGFSEKRRVIQARDAGVTEFLLKPFNARGLYKRLSQLIERPRQFVRAPDFFGPDRRRIKEKHYLGPWRRGKDIQDSAILKEIQERQAEAHRVLRNIREKLGLAKGDKFDLEKDRFDFEIGMQQGTKVTAKQNDDDIKHYNQQPRRKASFVTPPNMLRVKVGSGGLSETILQKAQAMLEESVVDFQPLAELYLTSLMKGIEHARGAAEKKEEQEMEIIIIDMLYPAMQLKANGGMFDYPLVTRIANRLVHFLEVIEETNIESVEIIMAFHTTIRAITLGRITGEGDRYGKELLEALDDVCMRYFELFPHQWHGQVEQYEF